MLKRIIAILVLVCIVGASFGLGSGTVTNEGLDYVAGHKSGYSNNAYSPRWSPNGTKIAYIRDDTKKSDVWVMDANGSNRTQLTENDDITVSGVEWSPDGTKIAYCIRDPKAGYSSNIWVMESDGNNKTQLTTDRRSYYPAWSPEGTKIAYSIRNIAGGDNNIWIMDSDGSNKTQLTSGWNIYKPVWNPEGTEIAYVSYATANPSIRIMDSDGGNTRELDRPKLTSLSYRFDKDPNWSPDGSEILFVSQRDRPGNWDILVVSSNLSNPTSLTKEMRYGKTYSYTDIRSYSYINPAWHPDGSKIAFTVGISEGNSFIWIMEANGSNKVQLYPEEGTTIFEGYFYDLVWSPDGSKLLFTVKKDNRNSICIMKLGKTISPTPAPSLMPTLTPTQTPAATAIATQEVGHLEVISTPVGAGIYIDDDYKGVTPLAISNVSVGNHSIRLTKQGYDDWTTSEDIKAEETSSVAATLLEAATPTMTPSVPVKTPSPPGFETIFAIAGLLAVAYLMRKKK